MISTFTAEKSLTDAFGMEMGCEVWDRFTVHFTPAHGSWLNQAEIEIGMFARQCLGSRRIPDLKTLRRGGDGRPASNIALRKRVHVNTLITAPGMTEIEFGGAFSTEGNFSFRRRSSSS